MALSSELSRPGRLAIAAVAWVALAAGCACGAATGEPLPVTTIPQLDLDRYMGQWFEIARTPNAHEEDCSSDVVSQYERRTEFAIEITSLCRHDDGALGRMQLVARVRDVNTFTKLEVRHAPRALGWLPFVWDDYWVLQVGPAYDYALIGQPDRESLWILARTPMLDATVYEALVAKAAAQGFDIQKLKRTPQNMRIPASAFSP